MEKFYFEKPSSGRKEDIIGYLKEHAEAGSDINGTGSLDRILSGWTFEEALERCLRMEEKDYALSREMITYWTDFIKTGDPNASGREALWNCYEVADGFVKKFE